MANYKRIKEKLVVVQSCYRDGELVFANIGLNDENDIYHYQRIQIEKGNITYTSSPLQGEFESFLNENLTAVLELVDGLID